MSQVKSMSYIAYLMFVFSFDKLLVMKKAISYFQGHCMMEICADVLDITRGITTEALMKKVKLVQLVVM